MHSEIITCLSDQPERKSINYIMLGNSTHSVRFQYAANINTISLYLPPCKKCVIAMKEKKFFTM